LEIHKRHLWEWDYTQILNKSAALNCKCDQNLASSGDGRHSKSYVYAE